MKPQEKKLVTSAIYMGNHANILTGYIRTFSWCKFGKNAEVYLRNGKSVHYAIKCNFTLCMTRKLYLVEHYCT